MLDEAWVEEIEAALPELPDDKKARFVDDYGLSAYDAGVLVAEKEIADYYETAAKGRDAKLAANWVTSELFGALNKAGLDVASSPVPAAALGGLIDLIADGAISGRIAKEVFAEMFATGKEAAAIVEEKGLTQVSDEGEIAAIVDQIIADNPAQAKQYRAGNVKLIGWFVGQVMGATQGKANPKLVNETLTKKLSG